MTLAVNIISTYLILKAHSVYEHTTKACFVTLLNNIGYRQMKSDEIRYRAPGV